MNPIANYSPFSPFPPGHFTEGSSFLAEQTRAGSISENKNTDLTITTDEGDTVTLSLASATEVNAGIHRSASYEDGRAEATRTAFFEFSTSRSFSIEIDGELNEQEREDIREAVQMIGGMIDDFLSGELQEMAADGELLKELDTIANLDAAFSYERQVTYGEQEKVEIRQSEQEASRPGRRRGHRRLNHLMHRIDRVTDDMIDQVKGFRGRRKHLGRSVRDLFNRYQGGEMAHAPAGRLGRETVQTMQSAFVQKLHTLTESGGFDLTYSA